MEDENETILLCDWQGVNLGGSSGDLRFFLSRLGGDGIQINTAVFLDSYVIISFIFILPLTFTKAQEQKINIAAAVIVPHRLSLMM